MIKNDTIKRANTIQQKIDTQSLEDKDMKSIKNIDNDLTIRVLQVEQRIKNNE